MVLYKRNNKINKPKGGIGGLIRTTSYIYKTFKICMMLFLHRDFVGHVSFLLRGLEFLSRICKSRINKIKTE